MKNNLVSKFLQRISDSDAKRRTSGQSGRRCKFESLENRLVLSTTLAQWTFDSQPIGEINGTGLKILENQFRAGYENSTTDGVYLPTGYFDVISGANDSGLVDLSADLGANALSSVAASFHRSSGTDYFSRPSSTFPGLGFGANSWGFGGSNSQGGENYFQFKTSTTGYDEIHLSFDQLRNNVGVSDDWSVWYSTTLNESSNGGTGLARHSDQLASFTKIADYTLGSAGSDSSAFHSFSFDFTSVAPLNDRTEIWIRLVNDGGATSSSYRSYVDNVRISSGEDLLSEIAPEVYFDLQVGSSAGDAVSGRVHLLDASTGGAATFQIVGGTGQALFDINTVEDSVGHRRGEIVVASGVTLNALNTYTLDVVATDGVTTTSSQTMNINVVASTIQDALLSRHLGRAIGDAKYTSDSQIAGYLALLLSDGSFSDIDYSVDGGHYVSALERISAMSEAYLSSPTYGGGASFKLSIYDAVEKWIGSINSINNLNNTITHPWTRTNLMGGIGLMMRDAIYADMDSTSPSLANRALTLYDTILNETQKVFTGWTNYNGNFYGANRSYRYDSMFKRAALVDDYNRPSVEDDSIFPDFTSVGSIVDIASLIETNLLPTESYARNGRTPDGALAHHTSYATQNLSLSYGRDWANRTRRAIPSLMGTPWEMEVWEYDVLADFYLDGMQWMVSSGQGDYTAIGRANGTKDTYHDIDADVKKWVDALLTEVGTGVMAREAELVAMSNQLGNPSLNTVTGNKDFWNHDFLVHRDDDFYVSVNMNSVRTTGPESGSGGEGKLSFYMSDGFTQIIRTGDEYNDTRVAWNWHSIPGTTAEQRTGALPHVNWGGNGQRGQNSFAGNVSNGTWGLGAFQYDKESSFATVNANKGYFLFEDGFVALGSDVRRESAGDGQQIWTTLNQTLWTSDVVYNVGAGTQTISFGSDTQLDFDNLTNPAWFHQDGVGYVVLPASGETLDVKLWAEERTGDWNDLNDTYSNGDNQSVDVFQLSINHGTNPTGDEYQYLVIPGIDSSAMQAYVNNLQLSVLANTSTIQAVRNDALGVTQIAFYQAGSLQIAPGLTVGVDEPALLMVHEQNGRMEISVSDPNHSTSLDTINVTVSRELTGNNVAWDSQSGVSTVSFTMSNDTMLAGQSVVQTLSEVTGLPADFNGDGLVTGLDFLRLQRGFGTTNASHADGDADGDQDVDGTDLSIWEASYSASVVASVLSANEEVDSSLEIGEAAAVSSDDSHQAQSAGISETAPSESFDEFAEPLEIATFDLTLILKPSSTSEKELTGNSAADSYAEDVDIAFSQEEFGNTSVEQHDSYPTGVSTSESNQSEPSDQDLEDALTSEIHSSLSRWPSS